jgi:hypothetical protein
MNTSLMSKVGNICGKLTKGAVENANKAAGQAIITTIIANGCIMAYHAISDAKSSAKAAQADEATK